MEQLKRQINLSHIYVTQEFSTFAKLCQSVGFDKYTNQLNQWKQEKVLVEGLASKGLGYKKIEGSYKVVIVKI